MSTPHDRLAKAVFSQLEHARSELSAVLPAALVERMDWSTLELLSGEFVDPALKHLHTDLLYTVRVAGRDACIYVLLEHMSTVERTMVLRLLRYMTRVWERFEQDRKGEPLPVIIPVVLHHSEAGWTAPTRFRELLAVEPELSDVVAPFVPDFGFVLDDLSVLDDEALRGRAVTELVRLALVALQRCRGAADPVGVLRPWMSTMVAVLTAPRGVEALSAVARYIMEVSEGSAEELRALFRELGPAAEEAHVPTIAEKIAAEALAQGLAKGRAEGQATLLLKQMTLRFGALPEWVVARVRSATVDELERWAERVLVATTLDDVLAG
jgi:predicted transposase/invertase (TIGR01784 family)